jgi:hypothetical protein
VEETWACFEDCLLPRYGKASTERRSWTRTSTAQFASASRAGNSGKAPIPAFVAFARFIHTSDRISSGSDAFLCSPRPRSGLRPPTHTRQGGEEAVQGPGGSKRGGGGGSGSGGRRRRRPAISGTSPSAVAVAQPGQPQAASWDRFLQPSPPVPRAASPSIAGHGGGCTPDCCPERVTPSLSVRPLSEPLRVGLRRRIRMMTPRRRVGLTMDRAPALTCARRAAARDGGLDGHSAAGIGCLRP